MFANSTWYSTFTRLAPHAFTLESYCQETDERRPFQVYAILDEIFLAGEIEETSKEVVLGRLDALEKLE